MYLPYHAGVAIVKPKQKHLPCEKVQGQSEGAL